jgi:8-oxo-dGTP pyrophosphatase MutT (NUDIX family)
MKKYPRTVACVMWFGDKVALAQRRKTKTFSGYWQVSGGKMEKGESLIEGIQREIKEEMNLFVPYWELEIADVIITDPSTEKCFLFERRVVGEVFKNVKNLEPKKCSPWKLFTITEALALENLMPGLKEYFQNVRKPA